MCGKRCSCGGGRRGDGVGVSLRKGSRSRIGVGVGRLASLFQWGTDRFGAGRLASLFSFPGVKRKSRDTITRLKRAKYSVSGTSDVFVSWLTID
jgi:hypothetical protein